MRRAGSDGWAQASLVVLRTLIGWHFLYEGYFKLVQPAWSAAGAPFPPWSSAGFLRTASGPFAPAFRSLAESSWLSTIDAAVPIALVAIGLMLMLGVFTQLAGVGALGLLLTFYAAAIPMSGLPEPRAEGAYLVVNKTLVEAAAVLVVLAFRTGRIAGLDRWRAGRTAVAPAGGGHP
jgi:thiosulfate dehydrogenase [quinone] large subunit